MAYSRCTTSGSSCRIAWIAVSVTAHPGEKSTYSLTSLHSGASEADMIGDGYDIVQMMVEMRWYVQGKEKAALRWRCVWLVPVCGAGRTRSVVLPNGLSSPHFLLHFAAPVCFVTALQYTLLVDEGADHRKCLFWPFQFLSFLHATSSAAISAKMSFTLHALLFTLLFACLASAKSLWSSTPAGNASDIIRHAYPIGNGRLAALAFGEAGSEKLSLNRDSLWSGGPFANKSYNGGNPAEERYSHLPGIRDWIWRNGTGNVSELQTDFSDYGSYQVMANLSVAISGIDSVTKYQRSLSLDSGVHGTTFTSDGAVYTISAYCSYPDDVCVYDISSSHALPGIDVSLEQLQENTSLITTSCRDNQVKLTGTTLVDEGFSPELGMKYDVRAQIVGKGTSTTCDEGVLHVPAGDKKQLTLVLAAGTNYNESNGDADHNYSFRGADPGPYVQNAINKASQKSRSELLSAHMEDYSALAGAFKLELPDPTNSAGMETSELLARYANPNGTHAGDPYLESLMFDYGRHLFICSGRENSLPPNLQGKWATALTNAWSADYHANINLQMNYWLVEQTGLGSQSQGLWDYMAKTWAPRGSETAELLYNAPGWVTHNEMNIVGHTAMKQGDDIWADYPASAAWMMQHVWDHYEYSGDTAWLRTQGYPLLMKPIAQFWANQLQEDQYFNDGTLVVNPCTSPEHGPTTFGCTHYQQLIHQLFVTTLQAASLVDEPDTAFLASITDKLSRLDTGLHIGSFNQIQEWKLDIDTPNDTHRHLSQLIGWAPGWSLSSYARGYTNATIQSSIRTSLFSRGVGIGPDANAGWEKVWRSACWARLNDTQHAYYELRLALYENFAANGLSMYSGHEEPFQIDANFGLVGAVLGMLVVDLPMAPGDDGTRTVVLGPAIPGAWGKGSVEGLRLRGGSVVDFAWDGEGLVTEARMVEKGEDVRVVNKYGDLLCGADS